MLSCAQEVGYLQLQRKVDPGLNVLADMLNKVEQCETILDNVHERARMNYYNNYKFDTKCTEASCYVLRI